MDLQLTNKTVLVTGSTAGVGFAIASLYAQEGPPSLCLGEL